MYIHTHVHLVDLSSDVHNSQTDPPSPRLCRDPKDSQQSLIVWRLSGACLLALPPCRVSLSGGCLAPVSWRLPPCRVSLSGGCLAPVSWRLLTVWRLLLAAVWRLSGGCLAGSVGKI